MLLGFKDYNKQAQRLADALDLPYSLIDTHHFPDGESKVTLPEKLPPHVVFCRSLDRPNEKLIELLLAAKTAKSLGATRLTLICPYLCYMRQDTAFNPGEAVSQSIIGELLAGLFDEVITVDPHLHRTHSLNEVFPHTRAVALSASPAMVDFLSQYKQSILIGPDEESEQWVSNIAVASHMKYAVAYKKRYGDRKVDISLPDIEYQEKNIILIDDIISSGETIATCAQQCRERGVKSIDALVTHALFAPGSLERLKQAGIQNIWTTDSITHPTNVINLFEILAKGFKQLQD